jgi:predicted AAA+ superfamily ATPase
MLKPRIIYPEILRCLEHKNAVLITGMRQVGKTTLLRQLYQLYKDEEKLWFDFDNPLDQLVFEDLDYRNIYAQLQKISNNRQQRLHVFIDEIQNFPDITRVVKYLIDHFNVKFFLTGSSNFYLRNLFPESLSGRKFLFYLSPLTFLEYLAFNDKVTEEELFSFSRNIICKPVSQAEYLRYSPLYEDYLTFGGFPEVVLTRDIETKKLILKNIFSSFFERDLFLLSDFKDIRELRDFIRLLVPRVGSMLDITRISSELGIDRKKSYTYLEFLQGTFFLKLIGRHTSSIDRSVAGGKKICFSDNGLLNQLGKPTEGQLLENAVINQLSYYGEVTFFNRRNTSEIDAILNNQYAFEIKTTASESDLRRLSSIALKLGIQEYFLVNRNYNEMVRTIFPMFL